MVCCAAADFKAHGSLQEESAAKGAGGGGGGAGQQMVTLRQMARATLGRSGGAAVSVVYLALSFSLLTAYIAKAHPSHPSLHLRHTSMSSDEHSRASTKCHPHAFGAR